MHISLIAATAPDFLIGTGTGLPWHLPGDLKLFRKLTIGKPVIVGRKTLEVLGGPLPGRPHIVLTHQQDYRRAGCIIAHTIEEAVSKASALLPALQKDEIMVIGGAEVYRAAMPFASRLYLTIVEGKFAGTTYLPEECRVLGHPDWMIVQQECVASDEKNPYAYRFLICEKRRADRIAGNRDEV